MKTRMVLAALIAAASLARPVATRAATAPGPATSWGYIAMDDGIQLRYTLLRPSAAGRFPVAINYNPYVGGSDPVAQSLQTPRLVAAGYAVLGVNVRGAGCSTGTFHAFDRREALDGVRVVEWSAVQPWSIVP